MSGFHQQMRFVDKALKQLHDDDGDANAMLRWTAEEAATRRIGGEAAAWAYPLTMAQLKKLLALYLRIAKGIEAIIAVREKGGCK